MTYQVCPRLLTKKESSQSKYASDCFILDQFTKGDDCEIQDIFSTHEVGSHQSKVADLTLNSPMPQTPQPFDESPNLLKGMQDSITELTANMLKLRSDVKTDIAKLTDNQTTIVKELKEVRGTLADMIKPSTKRL